MAARKFTTDELMKGLVFLLKAVDRLRRNPKDHVGAVLNLAYAGACIEYDPDYALQNYCDDESDTPDVARAEKALASQLADWLEPDGRARPVRWEVYREAVKHQRILVWKLVDAFGNIVAELRRIKDGTAPSRLVSVKVFRHTPGGADVSEVFAAAFLQKYGGTMSLRDGAEAVMLLQEYTTKVTLPSDEDTTP